jgi:hypothetical protein
MEIRNEVPELIPLKVVRSQIGTSLRSVIYRRGPLLNPEAGGTIPVGASKLVCKTTT